MQLHHPVNDSDLYGEASQLLDLFSATRLSRVNRVSLIFRVMVCYVLIAYVLIVIFGYFCRERADFALKGTDLIWTRSVVNNAVICQVYYSSAVTATAKILERFMKVINHIWMA